MLMQTQTVAHDILLYRWYSGDVKKVKLKCKRKAEEKNLLATADENRKIPYQPHCMAKPLPLTDLLPVQIDEAYHLGSLMTVELRLPSLHSVWIHA